MIHGKRSDIWRQGVLCSAFDLGDAVTVVSDCEMGVSDDCGRSSEGLQD